MCMFAWINYMELFPVNASATMKLFQYLLPSWIFVGVKQKQTKLNFNINNFFYLTIIFVKS